MDHWKSDGEWGEEKQKKSCEEKGQEKTSCKEEGKEINQGFACKKTPAQAMGEKNHAN